MPVLVAGDFEECVTNGIRGERFEFNGSGGDGGQVCDKEVPVCSLGAEFERAGTGDQDAVAGGGVSGPRSGNAVIAMHNEINVELMLGRPDMAQCVGAHPCLEGGRIESGRSGLSRCGSNDFQICAWRAGHEICRKFGLEGQADHVRG